MFDDLTTDLINFNNDNQYYVLIMGDFNSRTGTQQDFISFDYNFLHDVYLDDALTDTLVDEDTLQTLGISQNRTSSDTTSNNYGNSLIDFCKSSSFYLFNGRIGVDNCKGCFTTARNSVVDYLIGSLYLLSKCVDFEICDFNNLYSDIHRGIHFTLKSIINDQLSRDSTPPCAKTNHNNQAFIWDENKKLQFLNSINIEKVEILSDKITSENDINIDETVSEIVNIWSESAAQVFKSRPSNTTVKNNNNNKKRWFNNDCKNKRAQYLKSKNIFRKNKTTTNSDLLKKNSKTYKITMQKARTDFQKSFEQKI